jgi:acyl-CoA hydrolase
MQPVPAIASRFTTSALITPQDANPYGNCHGGVIMKHIDEAGAVSAMRHARLNMVTASIDRIDFREPGYVGELLILKASVNAVGRTSLEVGVRVEAENLVTGVVRWVASAYLTYVALSPEGRPCEVPPLLVETDQERRREREAIERRKMRLGQC